jgi:hypothetical protein
VSKGQKKPVSKATNALQEQLRRRRGERDLKKRFLIVCEDCKSAPNYFAALIKDQNLSAASIKVCDSKGNTQPIQVVRAAIHRKKAAEEEYSGTEPFDQVWCTIDGDYGAAINNARTLAQANQINLAISTMCFEYWVLLHFEDTAVAAVDCDGIISSLKAHYPEYSKGDCDFSDIVPNARIASERAKMGRRKNELPENQNPCSDVYLLIDAILGAVPPNAGMPSPSVLTPPQQQGKAKGRGRKG